MVIQVLYILFSTIIVYTKFNKKANFTEMVIFGWVCIFSFVGLCDQGRGFSCAKCTKKF